ncbi:MAG: flavodoxin [Eubacterium sp.]
MKWEQEYKVNMKKIISLFTVITLLLAFTACSKGTQNEAQSTTENQTVLSTEEQSTVENNTSHTGKTLVVYFSATGNTKQASEYIAKATKGDLFELVPKDAYTNDDLNWRDESSRVNYEHENENARDIELVSSTVENWDNYDTVFIGYPIWWGIAAWPVDTFVKANDFTGKTVVPFCTSASSGLGNSGKLLEDMAGTGEWLDGERFNSSVSQDEINSWLENLNIQ